MTNEAVAFSYEAMPPEAASRLRETAEAIRSSGRRQVEEVIATGTALLDAKQALGHGQFGLWLTAEFGWTIKTAQRWMAVAEAFGSNTTPVSHLPLVIIYRLAALPSESRERVLESGATDEAGINHLVNQETLEAKSKAVEAARSPEAKAREEKREKAKKQKWAKQMAADDAEQTARRERARLLVREIVETAPDVVDMLIKLLKNGWQGYALDELQRARAGEKVSAKPPEPAEIAPEPLNDFETREQWMDAMIALWNRASSEWREHFLSFVDQPMMEGSR